ncbi:serine hydrolase [Streptomyces sp. AM6-12]|uniref:serine hydrolase n=1 Tax=Streptomyces sp. AM6-12 TaxID=3345149 RepID=UPI0037B63019
MSSHPRRTAGALLASVAALLTAGVPAAAAATPTPQPKPTTSDPAPKASAPVPDPRATVAVLDLDAGGATPVIQGEDRAYDTASIVKVDILAALLLKAQDEHRTLTDEERGHAEPMIRRSDNEAANALWKEIGRAPGLTAANDRLGLTSTTAGPGGKWGLTRTTASDQIRLLRAVFDDGAPTPLTDDARAYIRTLMAGVLPEQSWGVSAVNAAGTELKNGWLQRTTTGLWDVNSIGEVTLGGHRCLVAVLSDGSASMSDGVSLVERTARAAVA